MFQGLFNYDNPVWRFIGKLGDLILLNLLWVVCSIPIITIGASTTAVYYVTLKLVRDEDDSTIRSFFHSFKSNFKQATLIWILLMAVGAVLGLSLIHICFSKIISPDIVFQRPQWGSDRRIQIPGSYHSSCQTKILPVPCPRSLRLQSGHQGIWPD